MVLGGVQSTINTDDTPLFLFRYFTGVVWWWLSRWRSKSALGEQPTLGSSDDGRTGCLFQSMFAPCRPPAAVKNLTASACPLRIASS
jgi:hypothetical protein